MASKASMRQADSRSAAPKPTSMARPPKYGVGTRWTLRSSGWASAPHRRASHPATGVSSRVMPKATAKTVA